MKLEEIDAPFRRAVSRAEGDEWDDPETETTDEDGDELGYRDVDEESSYDERGDQQEDDAA